MRIYGIKDKLKNRIIYIGKTKNQKDYLPHGKHILKIFKNTPERYEYIIIENIENIDELDEKEKYYIELYDTFNQVDCFNFTRGGTGGCTLNRYSSDERKKIKLKELNTKKTNPDIMKKAAAKARQTFLMRPVEEQVFIVENRIKRSIEAKKAKKARMTDEELEHRKRKNSNRVKEIHRNRDEEQKQQIKDKISKTLSRDEISLVNKSGNVLSLTFTQWKKLHNVDVYHLKKRLQKTSHGWSLP